MTFDDYNFTPNILKALSNLGFENPTTIQKKALPYALEGRDIVAQSQTGSGKTAAFGLPIIQNVKRGKGVQALILTPTRELCVQVCDAINDYSKYSKVNADTIYGGVSYNPQINALKHREIIVATPGRLIDHIERGNTDFSQIRYIVLDEADKMIEMGFLEDTERIIDEVDTETQLMLFSATFPDKINTFVDDYMADPVFIKTERFVSNKLLTQQYYKVHGTQKFSLLVHLLDEEEDEDTSIVFCSTRKESDFVTYNLKKNGIKAKAIHGGHTQAKRQRSIDSLHEGKISVLVATDVASRGLDIRNVTKIFNWDIPRSQEDYTHRVGRTARAGESGQAISFVTDRDKESFNTIQRIHKNAIEKVKTPSVQHVRMIRDESILEREKREHRQGFNHSKAKKTKKNFGHKRSSSPKRFAKKKKPELFN